MGSQELNMIKILWHAGIVVKFVLLLLMAASVISWAIILKKRKALKSVIKNNLNFYNLYSSTGSFSEVLEKCSNLPESPFKTMFVEGYGELRRIKSENGKSVEGLRDFLDRHGLINVERALKKGAMMAKVELDQFLSVLASIGSVSPFVGLLGTVWGIINAFTGIAKGGGSIEQVAPGIAEALIATAIGLFAAIPAVWFFNFFSNRISKVESEMECFGQELLNNVERTINK